MAGNLTRRAILAATSALAASSGDRFAVAAPARPRVGAIRWDAWFEGNSFSEYWKDPAWRDRLPVFTQEKDGQICVCGSDVGTLTKEVALAKTFGIDYFAFDHYYAVGPSGKQRQDWIGIQQTLDSFLKIQQNDVSFTVNFDWASTTYLSEQNLERSADQRADLFANRNYLKSAGNRPVCFVMLFNEKPFLEVEGASKKLSDYLDRLRAATARRGVGQPYFVVLNFRPDRIAAIQARCPFDAASSYGNPLGSNPNGPARAFDFQTCADSSRSFWKSAASSHLSFLPPVSMGWDYRPLFSDPKSSQSRSKNGDFCKLPKHDEIVNLIYDACRTAASSNPGFPSILIYAWNEYGEGGYLAPTRGEGTSRLTAVKDGLAKFAGVK